VERDIKDVLLKAVSLLLVTDVINERELARSTNESNNGYDDLYDLLEEKYRELTAYADKNNQK